MVGWIGRVGDGQCHCSLPSLSRCLQVTAAQKRRLGIAVDEDGEFWVSHNGSCRTFATKQITHLKMPWEEFVRHFTDISVCQLLNTQSTLEQGLSRQKSLAKASRRSIATIGMPEKQFREWASGWAVKQQPIPFHCRHSSADGAATAPRAGRPGTGRAVASTSPPLSASTPNSFSTCPGQARPS